MMKVLTLALVSLMTYPAFAKHDFNEMISASTLTQKELARDMQRELKVKNKDAPRARIVVVEEGSQIHVSKTRKDMLIFDKEKRQYRLSKEKVLNRVATEFSQAE